VISTSRDRENTPWINARGSSTINLETRAPDIGCQINALRTTRGCEERESLTYGSFSAHRARVSHGMQYRPVTIDGHRHQAEDADGAEDDEDRDGEQAGVQIRRQADAREDRERNREQSDQKIGRGQRDDVIVGASA